jgi:enoyl-CoA hydratase
VVISMLPDGGALLACYREVLPAATAGALFVDCSTAAVADARAARAARDLAAAGHSALDAPVSGGVAGAEAATLTFMVGAREEDFAAAAPPLEAMGRRVVLCGPSWAGQAAKLCNNLILGVSMIAVSEALVLGERLGLSNQALFDVASTASGQCWALTANCPVPGPVPASPASPASPGQPGLPARLRRLADGQGPRSGGPQRRGDRGGHAARRARGRALPGVRGLRAGCAGLLGDHQRHQGAHGMTQYETIRVERRERVGVITLNRPEALNALNTVLMGEVVAAAEEFDRDPVTGAVVLTGSERAFAAGADIKEMASLEYAEAYGQDLFAAWDRFARLRKPVVAAVAGYALGGGCELAMMCDILLAADTAKFGQPEIKLGVIPGIGGSQRLTRAVGKAKAMELVLTGRMMDAEEAERAGLVSRIVPAADLLDEAVKVAESIAQLSPIAVAMAKEAVNRAFETTLTEGVRFERRLFHATFATADQKEGMAAFTEKRPPKFQGR